MSFVQVRFQFPLNEPVEGGFGSYLSAYALPNAECSTCKKKFGYPGICYPAARGASIPSKQLAKLKNGKTFDCSWNEFVELANCLRSELPKGSPVAPGTTFGPARLKIRKEPPAVWLLDADSLILSATALETLAAHGFQLPTFPIEIVPAKWAQLRLFLAEAPPIASSGRPEITLPCVTCNGHAGRAPESVQKGSVPDGVELFKLRDRPDRLIMTERLATVLRSFPGSNINVEPIEAL